MPTLTSAHSSHQDDPIAKIYRITFNWIEPVAAFLGAMAAIFAPKLLAPATPNAFKAYDERMRPIFAQIGGGWLIMVFNDFVTLRIFPRNILVWRCILGAGICSDVVYIAVIIWDLGWQRFSNPTFWTWEDAFTIISTIGPFLLKIAFQLGIGVKQEKAGEKDK
ncbi:hypothetical protein CBOM_06132 [Ceraceosorus bombacis]|uniref:DUF7704 domain-containing protein n=1 Tax=Ceraceosorus bombacis TaxID=401625 RepID=A0A0N7LAD4_9BASI|nr:hypothetical protein CBOM_06132 [Ceraceosorus bombacis]